MCEQCKKLGSIDIGAVAEQALVQPRPEPTWREEIAAALRVVARHLPEYSGRELLRHVEAAERARAGGRLG